MLCLDSIPPGSPPRRNSRNLVSPRATAWAEVSLGSKHILCLAIILRVKNIKKVVKYCKSKKKGNLWLSEKKKRKIQIDEERKFRRKSLVIALNWFEPATFFSRPNAFDNSANVTKNNKWRLFELKSSHQQGGRTTGSDSVPTAHTSLNQKVQFPSSAKKEY